MCTVHGVESTFSKLSYTEVAGLLKASLLPCVFSFASQNWIPFPKLPAPRLRMLARSRHWAVSTSQSHERIFPHPRSEFPWSPALWLLENSIRLAAVPQALLSVFPPSLFSLRPLPLSFCFPMFGSLLSCPLCVLYHQCLHWRQGLGLGVWGGG